MIENKPSTLDDKLKTDERVRGNHAWNTCDGGVRGLVYSPERVKELVEKKHKKNYWKIGALVGGGIAAVATAGLVYFSSQKPDVVEKEVFVVKEVKLPFLESLILKFRKVQYTIRDSADVASDLLNRLAEKGKEIQKKEEADREMRIRTERCKELGIEADSSLCKGIYDRYKLSTLNPAQKDQLIDEYTDAYCRNPTTEGLKLIIANKGLYQMERFVKRVMSMECGIDAALALLNYPCESDYWDFLKPFKQCRGERDSITVPENFLKNAYELVSDNSVYAAANSLGALSLFRIRIVLLARIGMNEEFCLDEAKRMYNLSFGWIKPEERESVRETYTIGELYSSFSEKKQNEKKAREAAEFLMEQSFPTYSQLFETADEHTCSQQDLYLEAQLKRINIVNLLALDIIGRKFLEHKFAKSKDPVEIITICHHLYSAPEIMKHEEVMTRYLMTLAEFRNIPEVSVSFGGETCDSLDPLNACRVVRCTGYRDRRTIDCEENIQH